MRIIVHTVAVVITLAPAFLLAQELDAAVQLLSASTQDGYELHGYKDIELGASFEKITAKKQLTAEPGGDSFKFTHKNTKRTSGEEFIFDKNKQLIMHSKSYEGGPDDYLDELLKLFGKTEQKIQTRKVTVRELSSVVQRTVINYSFRKVFAQIFSFIRGMRAETEALAIEGYTKNGFWRHGSDVQGVKKSGPDQTNPIRAEHAIGASEA